MKKEDFFSRKIIIKQQQLTQLRLDIERKGERVPIGPD